MGCGQKKWDSNDCSDKEEDRKKEDPADDELRRERYLYKDAYHGLTKRIHELEKVLKASE